MTDSPYRRPGAMGWVHARWFYWRLYHRHVAKHRRLVFADDRSKGASLLGAWFHSYIHSRLIDWPRPYWLRALR